MWECVFCRSLAKADASLAFPDSFHGSRDGNVWAAEKFDHVKQLGGRLPRSSTTERSSQLIAEESASDEWDATSRLARAATEAARAAIVLVQAMEADAPRASDNSNAFGREADGAGAWEQVKHI